MNVNSTLRKLHRALAFSLVACAAASAHAEGASPQKPDYSGVFQKKADAHGAAIPRPKNDLKLDGTRNIPLEIKWRRGCFFGDLDLILLETSWGGNDEILVSLEPIGADKRGRSTAVVPVKELLDGSAQVTLTAPDVKKTTVAGLYICKDAGKTGSCKNKKVELPFAAFAPYTPEALAGKQGKTLDIPDRVYFYNYVIIEPDSLVSSSELPTEADVARVEALLPKASKKETKKMLSEVFTPLFTLGSVPLKQNDNSLVATLPLSDFSNCSK